MTIDAVQLVGLQMGEPLRGAGQYRYTVTARLAPMSLVAGRLEYVSGLDLKLLGERWGWQEEVRLDLALAESEDGGSPSIAEIGQSVLATVAQAVAQRAAEWQGRALVVDLLEASQ